MIYMYNTAEGAERSSTSSTSSSSSSPPQCPPLPPKKEESRRAVCDTNNYAADDLFIYLVNTLLCKMRVQHPPGQAVGGHSSSSSSGHRDESMFTPYAI